MCGTLPKKRNEISCLKNGSEWIVLASDDQALLNRIKGANNGPQSKTETSQWETNVYAPKQPILTG